MQKFQETIKVIIKDRAVFALIISVFMLAAALVIVVILNIRSPFPPFWSRYADFGERYYKGTQYYRSVFIISGLIVGFIHNALAIQLYSHKNRRWAIWLLGLSLLIMVISFVVLIRMITL